LYWRTGCIRRQKLEAKIASLTAVNSALLVENEDIRQQLMEALAEAELAEGNGGGGSGDGSAEELAELHEEFARRLGQADRQLAELRVCLLSLS
jgi:regulator of replication initiation timing